jgi:predicted Rossmann fold nucleotide-binding protein DprA/Smf involved in DNA uptake
MPTAEERAVLEVLARVPRSIDEVALLAGQNVVDMAVLLGRLEAKEWVSHVDGWWEALLQ